MTLSPPEAALVATFTAPARVPRAAGPTVLLMPAVTQELPTAIGLVCGLTGNRLRPRHIVAEALQRAVAEADQSNLSRQAIGRIDDDRGGETYWHNDGSGVSLTSTVVPLQVRLPVTLVDRVVALAASTSRTVDQVVTEALTRYLPTIFQVALSTSVAHNCERATWPLPITPGVRRVRKT